MRPVRGHISMFPPLIRNCLRCCGKSWERCPAASSLSARVGDLLHMNKAAVSDLSQPSLDSCWAPCRGRLPYIPKAWADTLWFLALVTEWGSSTPPGELFISHSPIWTICIFFFPFPFWRMGSKAPEVGVSVWKFPWYNFLVVDEKPNGVEEACVEKKKKKKQSLSCIKRKSWCTTIQNVLVVGYVCLGWQRKDRVAEGLR